jgi:exoribonuclease R
MNTLLFLSANTDVTYFVHPDSPIDKEAAHRSTSTYLVERRLDMLPGLLTTQVSTTYLVLCTAALYRVV